MDNKNSKFVEVLKTCLTSGNSILKEYLDISIIEKDGLPDIVIKTTDVKDELHLLMLQINFIANTDSIDEFISTICRTEETTKEFKSIFYKTLYTITTQIKEKLKLLKEN